jgi:hypothetical protein
MPPLTRWFIKLSFVYLAASLGAGFLVVSGPVLPLGRFPAALAPVYFHLFLVGWVSQLIFGVVFWMFPKFSPQRPRGSEALGWATLILINAGLLLRTVGEPLHALLPQAGYGWLLAVSAVLQWLGGLAFVANTWGRVKEK